MPATGVDSTGLIVNPPTEAPQVSMVIPVLVNIFTEIFQGVIGFTSTQVWVLVDDGYDSQEAVLYWKFIDIKDWCQLKSNIPVSRGRVSCGDSEIKYLQALGWWVTYLTLRGKVINLNNFKTDILADAIKE